MGDYGLAPLGRRRLRGRSEEIAVFVPEAASSGEGPTASPEYEVTG